MPRRSTAYLGVALAIAVGCARIVATYPIFVQTNDEPAHVAAGVEWLDRGRYTLEALHPPLARAAVALGPFLAGARTTGAEDVNLEGNRLLGTGEVYRRTLTLARLGALPFFIAANLVVFALGRLLYGSLAGLLAVVLFSTLPPVLAHAGLATTDMGAAATSMFAFGSLIAWVDRPTLARSVAVGLCVGLALATKLSALLFVPASLAMLLALRATRHRGRIGSIAPLGAGIGVAAGITFFVVWSAYGFSIGSPLRPGHKETHAIANAAVLQVLQQPYYPAPEWLRGIIELGGINHRGRWGYLLGETYQHGDWRFFPVVLLVKTPAAFLLLMAAGLVALAGRSRTSRDWRLHAPAAIALAVLVVCLLADLNLGVRHILPIYGPLALLAAVGLAALLDPTRRATARALGGVLLVWYLGSSVAAHPDYLAYMNPLGASQGQPVVVDSDLDWGQDLWRLAAEVERRGLKELKIAYFGTANPREHGIPFAEPLEPGSPATGWIAASLTALKLGRVGGAPTDYGWLDDIEPVTLIGRSIHLYCIELTPEYKQPEPDCPPRPLAVSGSR